ncbi:uracil-DNA glycosylase family protein [Mangrovicoccus sp. HB161399]|uniref:uracil-DNA glycosylase family protein n=1 Tax=Mangrovicoccus sp. HB161399 TaxID=2720392 RepID=UPI0015523F39|nr:uracil-DNA glycosylase family protein [Mangrovicoccus sp. HB161399]
MSERPDDSLAGEIAACRLCAGRFAATATRHAPRPVPWFRPGTRILVAGQAPGLRVHKVGRPFFDRSGNRLRDWMGIGAETFYDRSLVSVLPTAFCFPGYSAKGSDLPPPPLCWQTWHARALAEIGEVPLRLIVGSYAIRRHLGLKGPLTEIVRGWRAHAPGTFVLPHPSWRNNAWLKANPWFGKELLPSLRAAVRDALDGLPQG